MNRRRRLLSTAVAIVIVVVIAIVYGLVNFNVSALPEPGAVEVRLLTQARNWYVARAARASPPPSAPPRNAANVAAGAALYGMDCAFCHGQNPRTLAPIAHSMYPRVVNLSSAQVQSRSDAEIFWVIKHGIRLSGMPGFAPINSDKEIWQLTYFVRSLGPQPR